MREDILTPERALVYGEAVACRIQPRGQTHVLSYEGGIKWWRTLPGLWQPVAKLHPNTILYDWATIVCELLRGAPDGKPYKLAAMYIEFENNSGAAVTPPTIYRDEGRSYYDSLLSHPTRDYLRVPLAMAALTSSDETKYPRGNRLTFYAHTEGTAGVHGKDFSDSVSSRVYGGAIVATPDYSDATQDLVFNRWYVTEAAEQLVKTANAPIGLSWPIVLQ